MHPKLTTALEVTEAEVEATKKAFDWFFTSYLLCSNYAQKANRAETSPKQEDVAKLDARIVDLQTQLKNIGG
jgi:hypothetical protein